MTLRNLKVAVVVIVFTSLVFDGVLGVCNVESCTDPTTCLLSEDGTSCKCAKGFYSDTCEKDARLKVTCTKDYMSLMVVEDFFLYHNVHLESLHLTNESCVALREVIEGVPFYVTRVPKDQYLACGGRPLEKNITHAAYSLMLMSEPQITGNIIRDPVIKIEFTCVYPYVRTVSLSYPVIPFSSDMLVRVDDLDAKVQMMLYTDQTYATAYIEAPTIALRDKVYVEVKVTEPEDLFILRVDECWASQSPQPNATDGSAHTLVLNGCVSDETMSFLDPTNVTSGLNGESSTVRYNFDMFRFIAEPHDLYLHCSIQICEPDDQVCKPNCKSITKREAVSAHPNQGMLSYGPIKIKMPQTSQSNMLTTVAIPVAGIWIMGLFLIVLITVAKAGNRRLARTTTGSLTHIHR